MAHWTQPCAPKRLCGCFKSCTICVFLRAIDIWLCICSLPCLAGDFESPIYILSPDLLPHSFCRLSVFCFAFAPLHVAWWLSSFTSSTCHSCLALPLDPVHAYRRPYQTTLIQNLRIQFRASGAEGNKQRQPMRLLHCYPWERLVREGMYEVFCD